MQDPAIRSYPFMHMYTYLCICSCYEYSSSPFHHCVKQILSFVAIQVGFMAPSYNTSEGQTEVELTVIASSPGIMDLELYTTDGTAVGTA